MGDFNCGSPFVNFSDAINYAHATANLPALVGAHSIPGPAVGKIRIIFHALLTSDGATPAITAQLQPSGLFFGRAVAIAAPPAVSVLLFGTTQAWCLGADETMDITNTGTGDCTLWYTYVDIPDTNRTLVRTSFSDTPVDIIPAAPAGNYRKWLPVGLTTGSNGILVRGLSLGFNDDTATVVVENFFEGSRIGRQAGAGANTQVTAVVAGGIDLVVTTQPYQMATLAAVATRNVNFMGCYETFTGVP